MSLAALKPGLLARSRAARDDEECVAAKILQRAVEAPLRALLANAGFEPEPMLAKLVGQPAGYGFDVMRGEMTDLARAGIVDAAPVAKAALQSAIHSAALALTIDVLIQRANPPMGIQRP
jgi:chaperonin GroEL